MSSFRLGNDDEYVNVHIDTGMAYYLNGRGNNEDFYFIEQTLVELIGFEVSRFTIADLIGILERVGEQTRQERQMKEIIKRLKKHLHKELCIGYGKKNEYSFNICCSNYGIERYSWICIC